MNIQEHHLVMMMFARVYELIGQLRERLKSEGLWSADDEKAFAHFVRHGTSDSYLKQAMADYETLAQEMGVEFSLGGRSDFPPSSSSGP